jgi:hypothetical protein
MTESTYDGTRWKCAAELRKLVADMDPDGLDGRAVIEVPAPALLELADRWETSPEFRLPADIEDRIRRDERQQIARRLRASQAELLRTSARTEDAIGLICHQIDFDAVHRRPEPAQADEDGLT